MRINREDLLTSLEVVTSGLSPRAIIEQSTCFVFSKGTVMTFNDDVACRHKTKLKITGAVQSAPLLAILRKMKEEEVDVNTTTDEDSKLTIAGGKRRIATINMEQEILLPIESVESPKKWRKLPTDFIKAIDKVKDCAGRDETKFALVCVHITPKWIEACDSYQVARYRIKTGLEKSILIRKDSLSHVVNLDMTEFSETESWIHFRNPIGLIISCRRYIEEYHSKELTAVLKKTGEPTLLPKGLQEAADKAEVFSIENPDNNQVTIKLKANKLRITGTGVNGDYTEIAKIKYNGKPREFRISPRTLVQILDKNVKCEIGDGILKITDGKFTYVSCLGVE